jgi:membrane-bound ClpP family serine protease
MDPLAWSIILLGVSLVVVVIEVFVPSGGILGIISLVLLIAAVVMAFTHSYVAGTIVLLTVAVSIPLLFWVAVKVWPSTPIGRQILMKTFQESEVLPTGGHYQEIQSLVGRVGRAKTKMLPSGSIVIDGKTYDAISNGFPIESGAYVKVVSIRTNRPVVYPIDQEEISGDSPADMLAAPIDQLGIEGFDD